MRKLMLILPVLLVSGCTANKWDPNCPQPKTKDGYLLMESGVTKKCQIIAYSSECKGITDKTNANGLVCAVGVNTALFLFDNNDTLLKYRVFNK